jgi:hypothetical protein
MLGRGNKGEKRRKRERKNKISKLQKKKIVNVIKSLFFGSFFGINLIGSLSIAQFGKPMGCYAVFFWVAKIRLMAKKFNPRTFYYGNT